jgi:hypothetical protein
MSTSDILAAIALVVSLFTLVVALYFQYYKHGYVAVLVGEMAFLSYGDNLQDVGMIASVTTQNFGASDVVITRIEGRLRSSDGAWEAPLVWQCFDDLKDPGTRDPEFGWSPKWVMLSWAHPMIAPSRKAATSWVAFSLYPIPGALQVGPYDLTLDLVVAERRRLPVKTKKAGISGWQGELSLTQADVDFMKQSCVAVGNYNEESLQVSVHPTVMATP